MNALEEIERQLRVSVTARTPQEGLSTAGHPLSVRSMRLRAVTVLGSRRGLTRLAAVAAAIAAVGVAVALVPVGSSSGPSPAVAAVLQQLARIAASGPSLVPGPGQYLYTRSESRMATFPNNGDAKQCVTYSTGQRQLWVGADGSGLLREKSGPKIFSSASDRALCASKRITRDSGVGRSNLWFAADCFALGPAPNMSALSTNPRTLLRQMRRIDGGPRTAAEDFVHVGDFLRETDASPALRAALYRAAALIPGVRLIGDVRDPIGRLGVGVMMADPHGREELIFDRHTAALLGEETTWNTPGVTDWTAYLKSAVVNSVPYPSPVPLTTPCDHYSGVAHRVPGGTAMTGRGLK